MAGQEKEFAFDGKFFAVARVRAKSEAAARKKLEDLQCVDMSYDRDGVKLTEGSVDGDWDLIEIDGEAV